MPVQFICHQCQQLLSVSARKAGSQVKCPKCQASIQVPQPDDAAAQLAMRKAAKTAGSSPPEVDLSELIIYDDVAEFISSPPVVKAAPAASPVSTVEIPVDRNLVSVSRRMIYAHAALLFLLTLLGFAMGYAVGRARPMSAESPVQREPVQIVGSVAFMSEAGGITPDAGAVVIVFPVESMPDQNSRFPVAGLRPDQPAPDIENETVQAIESIDGVYLRASDEGRFSFPAAPGKYRVLIISAHVHRVAGAQPQPRDLAVLGNYFLPAPELVGGFQYRLQTLDLPRDAPIEQRFGKDGR